MPSPAHLAPEEYYDEVIYSPNWNRPFYVACKRAMDISVPLMLLPLLLPLCLVLGLIVKLTSPGPIFYRWRVMGKGGVPFVGYKFRSMCADADKLRPLLGKGNEMRGPVFKLTNDPRITKFGTWMRRYSLDELPQLYSALKGEMSLVGPRPPFAAEYEKFTPFQKQKLVVKPGITCLWQVNGRNRINDFDEWVRLDLEYIRRWSLWLDFKILVQTCREVFVGSGK